ncbi:hypothetical protein NA57DRAFT_72438 [Rhizodiscina lignyota]|uniref:Uncharacterized protein n=1 Tax=Rhizodiscina lignyota TaxID=1504668 RepID=A0A9P4IQE3_9PEZI|nr:hypothetical protein NA57DRAFT_72438 [Rhizodiscina lignyota]
MEDRERSEQLRKNTEMIMKYNRQRRLEEEKRMDGIVKLVEIDRLYKDQEYARCADECRATWLAVDGNVGKYHDNVRFRAIMRAVTAAAQQSNSAQKTFEGVCEYFRKAKAFGLMDILAPYIAKQTASEVAQIIRMKREVLTSEEAEVCEWLDDFDWMRDIVDTED